MTEAVESGGCLCGNVRFQARAEPIALLYCHCRMCQRASGAPVVAWAVYPAARFSVVEGKLTWFDSSDHGKRGFCGRCGSPLAFASSKRPHQIDLNLAGFDRAEKFPPRFHIWTSSAMNWLVIDDHLPRHTRGSVANDG
jgi:hypothetical protein